MELKIVNYETNIVCCFMNDNGNIYEGEAFNYYYPVISELEFKATTDIKFNHKSDVSLNINAYDERNSNKKLNQLVKKSKKIDVSVNDINLGGTDIIFNFTEMKIVIYDKYNIPHCFYPLDNDVLKEKYRGKIVIITIHRLNNPSIMTDIYGDNRNYLEALLDQTKFKKNVDKRFDEFNKVIEFAYDCWKKVDYLSNDYKCNSIKVVTATYVNADILMPSNKDSCSSLVIPNKGLLITRDTIFAYKENPSMHKDKDVDLSEFKKNIIPGTKFMFIVDNNSEITDRYYVHFGKVCKVPKFSNVNNSVNGLHIVTIGDNFLPNIEEYYELKDIDNLDFIYKTKEEAETGADKASLFSREIKEHELKLQKELIETRKNYEKTIHKLKLEAEEIKHKYEQKAKEEELKFNNKKRELEELSLADRFYYDKRRYSMKDEYEERRYKRDSFVEGLKTVCAVAGIAATGIMLYKKMNNN